jgi:acyl carrier protein
MKYLARIKTAFSTVLGRDVSELITASANMEGVPGWDSTNFIELVLAVEDEFCIELATIDATALTSIDAINRYLVNRLG